MGIRGRTSIGVYMNWPEGDAYQRDFLRGVHEAAVAADWNVLVFAIGNLLPDPAQEYQGTVFLKQLTAGLLDGAIFLSGTFGQNAGAARLAKLVPAGPHIPLVSVGDRIEGISAILLDNRAGYRELLSHLFGAHGYRRPVFVAGPELNRDSAERLECFRQALGDFGLEFDPAMVWHGNFTFESGEAAVAHFLDTSGLQPDIFVCANDNMAIGAHQALARRNRGGVAAVTGFDDIAVSDWCESPLTTVRQPLDRMGHLAVQVIGEHLAGRESGQTIHYVPAVPVIRSSCGCREDESSGGGACSVRAEQFQALDALVLMEKQRIDDSSMSGLMREYLMDHHLEGHAENERNILGRLGIGSLYISLFEDTQHIFAGKASLKIAWDEGTRREVPAGGQEFKPENLLPGDMLPASRTTLLATIVEEVRESLGMVLIAYGVTIKQLDLFRNHLSEAILSVNMSEKLRLVNEELRAAQVKLEVLSQTDELTGHFNRRGFMTLASRQVSYCRRQGEGFWILYLDLDGLKAINDSHGHDDGDLAIKALGDVLRECFRASDIPARLGGDEFTVLAAAASPQSIGLMRERLDLLVGRANRGLAKPWSLGVSVGGFYSAPDCLVPLERMMAQADQQLYEEKRRKKGL